MLNRYLAGKKEEKTGPRAKRPYLATECNDLAEADKWRQQILREIGKKVMEIQNAGLGEHRLVRWRRTASSMCQSPMCMQTHTFLHAEDQHPSQCCVTGT